MRGVWFDYLLERDRRTLSRLGWFTWGGRGGGTDYPSEQSCASSESSSGMARNARLEPNSAIVSRNYRQVPLGRVWADGICL